MANEVSAAGRVRRRKSAIVPLLPILAFYVVIVLAKAHDGGPPDEGAYLFFARNLTHGFYAQTSSNDPSLYLWHGPGLPLLITPLVALHAPVWLIRIWAAALPMFATMVIFHRMARDHLGPRSALLATYLVALYPPFYIVDWAILSEPLAILLFTLAAFFLVRSIRTGGWATLGAGIALGGLALVRIEYGWVLALGLVLSGAWWAARRGTPAARRCVAVFAVAIVFCLPWLSYTYSLTHRVFYWGNSGGLSLYWMAAPAGMGDWHIMPTLQFLGQPRAVVFRVAPWLRGSVSTLMRIDRLAPLAQDPALERAAISEGERHIGGDLLHLAENISRLLFNSPYADTPTVSGDVLRFAGSNLLLLVLLAVSLAVARRRRVSAEGAVVAILVAVGFLIHVPAAGDGRFLFPLVPAACWLIVRTLASQWYCMAPRWQGLLARYGYRSRKLSHRRHNRS